jgi:hypothetical protein
MEVIKNESYHSFCMRNERNKAVGVHGNKNINIPVPVFCIEV